MYSIITQGKKGYRNHPATQEFVDCPELLHDRLSLVRQEMLNRGYHPKDLPPKVSTRGRYREWESLETQIEKLKLKSQTIKHCTCLA